MGNKASKLYSEEDAILPINLRKDLFTTAAVDNINVNQKFLAALTSLHGTAASLNHHLDKSNTGVERTIPNPLPSEKVVSQLLLKYTEVETCNLPSYLEILREYELSRPLVFDKLQSITDEDQHWLNYSECTSWTVFHAKKIKNQRAY